MEYVAKQGTTALGIIGTALGGLAVAGGSLLAANGGRAANGECSENTPVSRYELGLQQRIAEQGAEIGEKGRIVFRRFPRGFHVEQRGDEGFADEASAVGAEVARRIRIATN